MSNQQRTLDPRKSFHIARIPELIFFFYLVSSPLIVYGLETPVMNLRFSRVLLLLSIGAVLIITPSRIHRLLGPRGLFEMFLFLVLIYGLVGGIWSDKTRWTKRVFGWAECCTIYYLIVVFIGTVPELVRAVKIYCISVLPVILVCGYQIWNLTQGRLDATAVPFPELAMMDFYDRLNNSGEFGVLGDMTRLTGTFGEPNMLAGYIASMLFLIGPAVAYSSQSSARIFLRVAAWALLACCLLTFSKSGYLSLLAGGLLVFSTLSGMRAKLLRFTLIGCVICAILLLRFNDLTLERWSARDSGHLDYTVMILERFFAERPVKIFFGVGFGGLIEGSSHTFLITIMYELGVVGIVLWTWSMFIPVRLWLRSINSSIGNGRYLNAMIAAAVTSVSVGLNLYDYLMYPFVWIVIGFGVVSLRLGNTRHEN